MNKNGLRRHYGELTPEERFRLDVLATARGDGLESERLVSSCPKSTYRMTDPAFSGRWLGAMDVTLRVYLDVAARLDKMLMIDAVRVMIPYQDTFARDGMHDAFLEGHKAGARQGWRKAGGKGRAPEWPLSGVDEKAVDALADARPSLVPEVLDRFERDLAAQALTIWTGFRAFCEDRLGVEAVKVLRVVAEPGAGRIEALEEAAERLDLEPDAEAVEEIRGGLVEAWDGFHARGL